MNAVSMNLVTLLYLVASVCFIQALKGLSSPASARMGNAFGIAGMGIAAFTTVALILKLQASAATGGAGFGLVLLGTAVGGVIGAMAAKRVEMTKMPELVAAMHSLIGLAAVCIAVAAVSEPLAFRIAEPGHALPFGNRFELFLGTFIGALTFSGSVIAFGKLSGKYKFRLFQGAPVRFAGQHILNLLLAIAIIAPTKVPMNSSSRFPKGSGVVRVAMLKAQGSDTAATAMHTAARPISECMAATSSGILVISTRLAAMAPIAPPTTTPSSTSGKPMPRLPSSSACSLKIRATVVNAAIAMPTMPKVLPMRALLGEDRPLSAWMKHTEATR